MVGAFRKKRLCVFLFCFVCFRSRSYPVPHRGERVKQGTVHNRNTAIITSQNFFVARIIIFSRIRYLIWLMFFATFIDPTCNNLATE